MSLINAMLVINPGQAVNPAGALPSLRLGVLASLRFNF
jgi:hypothetical protein